MSVWWGVLGAVVLTVVVFALGRGIALWLTRTDELSTRQRSAYNVVVSLVLPLVLIGVPVLFRLYPVGYAVLDDGPAVAAALLNGAVSATAVVVILRAGLRGVRPFVDSRMSVDGALSQRGRRARYSFVVLTVLVVATVEFGALYGDSATGLLVLICLLVALGNFLVNMVALPGITPNVQFGYRRPTDGERDRIEECYERLGRALPDGIEVTRDDESNGVAVLAHDGGRVLALSDSVLSSADRDTLTVAINHAEGRAEHGTGVLLTAYVANLFGLLFLLVAFLVSAFLNGDFALVTGAVVIGLVVCGGLVGAVVAGWRRRRVLAVDDDTVERLDPSVVAAVYRDAGRGLVRVRQTTGIEWFDDASDRITPELTIEDRIERLQPDQSAEERIRSTDEWVEDPRPNADEWVEETPTQPSGEYGERVERGNARSSDDGAN